MKIKTMRHEIYEFWRECGFSIPPIVSALLKEDRIKKSDIAKQAGCSVQYVNMVLSGSRNSKAVESAISQALGFNPWAC